MSDAETEAGLSRIGATSNTQYFTPPQEQELLIVSPTVGMIDNPEQARENVAYQCAHAQSLSGKRCGVVVRMDRLFGQDAASRHVYMDRVAHQTAAARAVYRDAPDEEFQRCFALVGGTMFGRAIASIFLGLSAPRVPTRMFATMDAAFAWARERAAAP